MKKLLGIVALGLLWCNVGFANILLVNCRDTVKAGDPMITGSGVEVWKKDKVFELEEGERVEYFVSFQDGHIYFTKVRSDDSIFFLEGIAERAKEENLEIGPLGSSKVYKEKYTIDFVDEKNIIATRIKEYDKPKWNHYEEIDINLNTYQVTKRIYADTPSGEEMVKLLKDMLPIQPKIQICEKEKSSNSSEMGGGTAFFISKKGYLLTNNHVVEGCTLSKISYKNKNYETKLIATDKTLDLALLKAEIRPNIFFNFSKDEAKKLSKVYVAGYPLGKGLSDDLKISSGIVSSLKGFEDNSNEIQIDAPINPGNSGGPIINENGDLIAIAVSGLAKDLTEGINFGIKASAAENFLKSNKINPKKSMYSGIKDNDKLLKILEEGTVYTFCN